MLDFLAAHLSFDPGTAAGFLLMATVYEDFVAIGCGVPAVAYPRGDGETRPPLNSTKGGRPCICHPHFLRSYVRFPLHQLAKYLASCSQLIVADLPF